ncbi:hypothetical protein [Streptomyces aureus]|uniref:hypothetical protein n=1 Tax=Streptomyces aureus TaxID=193461 RepID=UPI00131B9DF1|nr:hypothetical protein [Streptomyces aureus]
MTDEARILIVDTEGTRRVALLLQWSHSTGEQAHCLARLVLRQAEPPLAVLSELDSNPDRLGLTGDMAGAADAFLVQLQPYADLDPQQVVWIAHHGSFSSPDSHGAPETFMRVELPRGESGFQNDLRGHHMLADDQAATVVGPLNLQPVPQVLTELRSVGI